MKKIKNLGSQKNGGTGQVNFEMDKELVATTGATFCVKYLGYNEVKESRGVKVCSAAVNKLVKEKKNKKKVSLKISLDGVNVVDDVSRVLILDQPIEKISFCAPDSLNPRLFSYIARDGATRRWLCYGFYSVEHPGERLSHALGCAFTACLQRKQRATKNSEAASSTGSSSKDSSPAAAVKAKPPITKAYTTASIVTLKRPPPKEITVPLPESVVPATNPNRDRSATTIGIATTPGDGSDPPTSFTADLADILLFDPTEDVSRATVAPSSNSRPRAATEHPSSGDNGLDMFDPLHPTFKAMQFEDDFRPTTTAFHHQQPNPPVVQFSSTNPFLAAGRAPDEFDAFDAFASSRILQR